MRSTLAVCVVVLTGCGSMTGTDAGVDGGADGGAAAQPMPTCTPEGFTIAPSNVNALPVAGLTNADEHQAYAELDSNDGGAVTLASVRIDLWDTASDGGPNVPPVSVRFNGCDLGAPRAVPGVGVQFSGMGAAVWAPAPSRFVTFEVVSADGVLLYRNTLATAGVMPVITQVTNPAGPMATVTWNPIPDAGVTEASIIAWRVLSGGLQSVGFASNVDVTSGSRTMMVNQAPGRFDLEVRLGSGLSRVRLVAQRRTP